MCLMAIRGVKDAAQTLHVRDRQLRGAKGISASRPSSEAAYRKAGVLEPPGVGPIRGFLASKTCVKGNMTRRRDVLPSIND